MKIAEYILIAATVAFTVAYLAFGIAMVVDVWLGY